MLTVTKGELWLFRKALEEKDPGDVLESLEVIKAILVKNVQVVITEDGMYKDPLTDEPTKDEQQAILDEEEECHL